MSPASIQRLHALRAIPPAVLTLAELIELGELEALAQAEHLEILA